MSRDAEVRGGLLSYAMTRAVPSLKTRILVFSVAALGSMLVVLFTVFQLVVALDAANAMRWAALFGGSLCGMLTHASLAYGFYARLRPILILADMLVVASFIFALVVVGGGATPSF